MMEYKQCPWCGAYFIAKGRKVFCTDKCRRKHYKLLIELETEREYKNYGRQKPKYIGVGI